MKKINIFVLSAATAIGALFVSCEGGISTPTNASLKSQVDTLSYAYGQNLVESGLSQMLHQTGVLHDTAAFKMNLQQLASMEADEVKKEALLKAIPAKLDSVKKVNAKSLSLFLKGMSESLNTTGKEKDPYYNGVAVGLQIKQMSENFEAGVLDSGQHINKAALIAGLNSGLKFEKSLVTNPSQLIQDKAMAKREVEMKKQESSLKVEYADKIAAEEKFLEENKGQEGVVTLASGLQYKVVREGKGAKPTASDRVTVNYRGTLIDGTEFDSNTGRDPISFNVDQVIKGWTEALQLMPAGSKWMLYIPSDLAYGAQQSGKIDPFSTLVFEVELLGVEK